MVDIHLNENSIHRANSGAVWGNFYLTIEGVDFPGKDWNDLVAGILRIWLETLPELTTEQKWTAILPFMDGPYHLQLDLMEMNSLSISAIERRNTPSIWCRDIADMGSFKSALIAAASKLITKCEEKGWMNADCDVLGNLIAQS